MVPFLMIFLGDFFNDYLQQVTPAGREETLSRLEAIERALSELRRNPAVPEKELQDILTRLAELRKSGQEQRQSFGGGQEFMIVATFGCLKEMLETMKRVPLMSAWQKKKKPNPYRFIGGFTTK